jgi:hypothetical protein
LPWPLPERPTRICICQSSAACYTVEVSLEQFAKDDPHGLLALRAEKFTQESWPFFIAGWRVPLAGLARERAESDFMELARFLRCRARTDAICVEAQLR